MLPTHSSHRSRRKHNNSNNTLPKGLKIGPDSEQKIVSSYKTQRLPRSADPSPQRTVERIESFGEKHGGLFVYRFYFSYFEIKITAKPLVLSKNENEMKIKLFL